MSRPIELEHITIDGTEYAMYCDAFVLEQLQDEYLMAINAFERDIKGLQILRDREGNPMHDENGNIRLMQGQYKISTVMVGLYLMLREGCLIQAEQGGPDVPVPSLTMLKRMCDVSLDEITRAVVREFDRCFVGKKKEPVTKKPTRKRRKSPES